MGSMSSTYRGGGEKCFQFLAGKGRQFGKAVVNGKIILKCVIRKKALRMKTEFISLRKG
jgi:hypothetical protein